MTTSQKSDGDKQPDEGNQPDVYEYIAGTSNRMRAWQDLNRGAARWRLWRDMALRNFMNQYRGTIIGPLWITVTSAMTATGLGLLYAQLFGLKISEHLPYVTISLTIWTLLSTFISLGTTVFTANAHIFKEYPLPLSIFPFRLTVLQALNTAFRFIVIIGVVVLFRLSPKWEWFYALFGLVLIFWSGFWASMTLGIINARFRDFGQLIGAMLTFIFFVTPIFWKADRLGEYSFVVDYNPFYHLIETVRTPLLGGSDLAIHFAVAGGIAIVTPIISLLVYGRFSHRLPYWC